MTLANIIFVALKYIGLNEGLKILSNPKIVTI